MNFRHNPAIKIISAFVLFFFTWSFGGVIDIAYAAKSGINGQVVSSKVNAKKTKEQSNADKFQKTIEGIEQIISGIKDKSEAEINVEKGKLRNKKSEIETLDNEIKKQFAETEKKLKDEGLPAEILDRHYKFVKHYEDNLNELKKNLDAIDKAKDRSEIEKEIEKTKTHLEKVKPPKRHIPLDPNKLPHRSAEPVFIEPRTSPEEFQKDREALAVNSKVFKDQKNASRFTPHDSPILVASNGSLSGLLSPDTSRNKLSRDQSEAITQTMLLAAANPPSPADLAQTIEVQFTPAIQAKAAELGHNPVKIYNWVRNNIEYVPTYGSIQGADMCLQTKQCNDFDTASLLIALLRASGISARYVYGTIEMPIEKVMNWVGGFTDPMAALNFVASGGIPVRGLTSGGKIINIRMEHIWVEAFVDYIPSRGARHKTGQGDTWIPLDASYKEYDIRQGIDFSNAVPFDPNPLLNEMINTATINDAEGWITGIDGSLAKTAISDYRTQIEAYLSQNNQNATIGDIVGTSLIIKHEFPILVGTLPYKTVIVGARYQEIPDSKRHQLRFKLENGDIYGDSSPLDVSYYLPKIAGKKITVSYSPASFKDEAVINSYLPKPHTDGSPINLSELPTSLPAYLINLKPELRIDGQVVATGNVITMGSTENFYMSFIDPVRGSDIISNTIVAGEYWGIAVGVSQVSREVMKVAQNRLVSIRTKLLASDFAGLTSDDLFGEMLFYTAMLYNARIDGHDTVLARSLEVKALRFPSEAIFKSVLKVNNVFGVPVSASAGGLMMDVDRNLSLVKAFDGDNSKKLEFMRYSGINTSAFEHRVPEQLFTRAGAPAEAISAVKALQIANDSNMPIYTITKDNIAAVLPQLQLDAVVIADIRNVINSGKEVTVSKTDVTFKGWTGCGYITTDPATGASAYMISGGQSGAYIMITMVGVATGNPVVFAAGLALLYKGIFTWVGEDFADFVEFAGVGATYPKDWCGSEGTELVPDYPFAIDATHACMLHDWCYSTGFTYFGKYPADKSTCDKILGSNIYHDCMRQGDYTIFECGLVSDIYWLGVTLVGSDAFKKARKQ